jgi:hypothetical protein
VAAIFAAFGIWVATASASPSMSGGPASALCEAQGGTFVPPDETQVSYTCSIPLETLQPGQITAAKKVCENAYGATFFSFRTAYLCQTFS